MTTLENEFLEYQLLDDSELPDTSLVTADGTVENRRIDEVWSLHWQNSLQRYY